MRLNIAAIRNTAYSLIPSFTRRKPQKEDADIAKYITVNSWPAFCKPNTFAVTVGNIEKWPPPQRYERETHGT